jgi:DNA repair protein RecO
MKGSFKDEAFVLKKRALLNRNILIDLFTREHGHIVVIAYNAGKLTSRRGPHLETGNLIKIEAVKKAERFFLSETTLVSGFSQIKDDKAKTDHLYLFLYFLEHILPEGVKEDEVFNLFKSYLVLLTKEGEIKGVTRAYLNRVLQKLGYLQKSLSDMELNDFIEDLIGEKLPSF